MYEVVGCVYNEVKKVFMDTDISYLYGYSI